MTDRLLRFITLSEYRDQRGRRRLHRWNAVTHKCATDEQHQQWMNEQAAQIRREEDYRLRVGTTERMGRVLGLDGAEIPQPVRTEPEVPLPTPAPPPVLAPEPAALIDYSGCTPHPDIAVLPVTARGK